ncbi:hypothetical protein D7S86_06120 [Pararobbsia silviterrae]|uniref:Pentapeptide repeat-containing protein n=1 Tax=Pararobbsia silviterrae TaxID=1792498 RepID=A0A494Y6F9_9BURK|nr:hypothetical protein D7S86_06120 [Pararobbsia silviterrae]
MARGVESDAASRDGRARAHGGGRWTRTRGAPDRDRQAARACDGGAALAQAARARRAVRARAFRRVRRVWCVRSSGDRSWSGSRSACRCCGSKPYSLRSLTGSRLTGSRLTGSRLIGSRLIGARLTGSHLTGASLGTARLAMTSQAIAPPATANPAMANSATVPPTTVPPTTASMATVISVITNPARRLAC